MCGARFGRVKPQWVVYCAAATRKSLGIIYMSTVDLESFIDAIVGKRLTYERLIAKVGREEGEACCQEVRYSVLMYIIPK